MEVERAIRNIMGIYNTELAYIREVVADNDLMLRVLLRYSHRDKREKQKKSEKHTNFQNMIVRVSN